MQLEVEQKFPLASPGEVERRLAELGVVLSATVRQIDTYFRHPSRDFRQTDEAFRLRQVGEENYVTYKGPKLDAATKTRHELELPLPSGAGYAGQFHTLLLALGFAVGGTVSKRRRHGEAVVDGLEIDLAWDEVDDLGTFLELEMVVEDAQLNAARQAIQSLATRLGLAAGERRSYLELLEDRRG